MPFPHCYHPGIEAIPPQMKVDPSKSPFPYEQIWPYAGSYGQSFPCCGHNNFPGYYCYRPSYPHSPAPSPMYHSGCYPAYGEPSFVPYSPQPHYTMELPRYEYDKYMPRDYHCCGCPNHPYHQKEGKSVKFEEQEPDAGKKVNDALVPAQLKNYPYPFVLVPPEYASNKELKNPVRAEAGEQDKLYHDRKPSGPGYFRVDAQEPRVWNGWLPFDMNSAPNIVHEGDVRRNQNWETENNRRESEDGRINPKRQSEYKGSEFPFPIIWMPCYNKQEEGGMTDNQENTSTPKCIEEVPNTFKSAPVNSYANEGVTKGTGPNQNESTNTTGSDVTKKVPKERIIPVQQVESHQGKNGSEGSGKKERNIPVNQREDVAKNDSHTGVEKQSTSPRKTSKLPPVCLRVDPLPRNKNGNGSSRSSIPPASKEHSQSTVGETSKTTSGGMNDKAQPNSNCQNAPNISEKVKPKERIIQVSESKTNGSSESPSPLASKEHSQATAGETSQTCSGGMNDKAQSKHQNAPDISDKVKPKERIIQVTENKTSEDKGAADGRDECQSRISLNLPGEVPIVTKESCTDGDKEESKAQKGAGNMMEEATELQEVRDWSKPTDEGRKEEKVLSDVDAAVLIQAAFRGYQVRKWEPLKKLKQLAEVSEEVTNVRGRIQTFEESSDLQSDEKQRISIGETIMRLLLKLDTIQGLYSSFRETRKSLARELNSLQERLDSIKANKPQQQMQEFFDSKPVEDTPLDAQNGENVQDQQEEVAVPAEGSSESNIRGSRDTSEECLDQSCTKGGINSLPADDGGSESQSPMNSTSNEGTNPTVLSNGIADQAASDLSQADKVSVERTAKSTVDDILHEVDKLGMTTWDELPVGVVDEDTIDISAGKDEQNENKRVEAMDRSLPTIVNDEMIELPVGLLDEGTATSEFEKDDETKNSIRAEDGECIVELPVGLLDEDTRQSEFEKHDEAITSEEVLPAEGVECNANAESSSTDETAKETQLEQQQQQLEEQEEVQSSQESDGWVKIEFQKEGGHEGDAPLDKEVVSQPGEEIGNDTKVPSSITQVKGLEPENGDECLEINKNIQPEPVETVITAMEDVPINDLQREGKPEEKVTQRETQVEGHDLATKYVETLASEEAELSAASHDSEELPVAEHDGDSNIQLLEENEKLRKMLEKLLEAGNDQLNVISDLTGRVKDLEKKLARSKRVRTERYRPATSKFRSNNPLQHRAIDVTM